MVSSEAAASVSALAASSDLVASALVESSLLPVSVPASLLSVFAGVSVWAVDCWVSAADWSSAMAVALTPATPPSIATAATTATSRLPLLPAAPPTAANHSAILFIALPVSYDRVRQSLASHLQGVTLLSKKHECVHPDRGKFLPDIEKNLGISEKWHPRHPPYDNGLFRPCGACCSHNSGIGGRFAAATWGAELPSAVSMPPFCVCNVTRSHVVAHMRRRTTCNFCERKHTTHQGRVPLRAVALRAMLWVAPWPQTYIYIRSIRYESALRRG